MAMKKLFVFKKTFIKFSVFLCDILCFPLYVFLCKYNICKIESENKEITWKNSEKQLILWKSNIYFFNINKNYLYLENLSKYLVFLFNKIIRYIFLNIINIL